MRYPRRRIYEILGITAIWLAALVAVRTSAAQDDPSADPNRASAPKLRHVTTVKSPELNGAVNIALSPDGRFAYCPAWRSRSIAIFQRDAATGLLEPYGSLFDSDRLAGVVHVRLNRDGALTVATSFQSKSVCLFSRDAETGGLHLQASATAGNDVPLGRPTDSVFSPDSRFIYTVDDQPGAVHVFRVAPGKLEHVQRFEGREDCLAGSRGIAMLPGGRTVLVTGTGAGTLCVLARDEGTGRLSLRQVLSDGQGGIQSLAGSMCIECSSDGKFVYTTSGRFGGDQAVTTWKVADDGTLSLLQEFMNGKGLKDFTGGNELQLSSDGRNLYASGTTSCTVVCFRRNPADGRLVFQQTLRGPFTGVGSKLGANGLACSPDGRFVYLALEDASAISIFERK